MELKLTVKEFRDVIMAGLAEVFKVEVCVLAIAVHNITKSDAEDHSATITITRATLP